MNRRLSKLVASTLVAIMLVFAMPVITPKARAGDLSGSPPSFYILPDTESFTTASPPPSNQFTVTVYAAAPTTGAPPIPDGSQPGGLSYYVTVGFNAAQLRVVSIAWTNESGTCSYLFAHYGINPSSDWGSVPPFPNHNVTIVMPVLTYNNVAGTIEVGESLLADEYITAGSSGSLFTITFQMILSPPAGGSLTSLIDPSYGDAIAMTYWIDTASATYDYTNGLNEQACTYIYTWSVPTTKPWLEVVNYTENTFDMYHQWIGTTFTECIYINNLDIGWSLKNVTADFVYNGALLSFVSIQVDPTKWGHASIISNVAGDLKFELDGPASTPYTPLPGSPHGWPLVNVTLQILTQGDSPPLPDGSYDFSVRTLNNILAYSTLNSEWTGAPQIPLATPQQQGDLRQIMVFAFLHARVYVHPEETVVVQGGTFTIDVNVDNVADLNVWQIVLNYNSTILTPINVEGQSVGWSSVGWSYGWPFISWSGWYPMGTLRDNYVLLAGAFGPPFGVGPGPFSGSCTLCRITFQALTEGISYLNISLLWPPIGYCDILRCAVTFDTFLDDIPFYVINGEVRVVPITHTLTITTTAGGTTSPSPSSYVYNAGTSVPVTAIPDTYYTFGHWELDGNNVGTNNPISVTMDLDHTLHAVFIQSPVIQIGGESYTITIGSNVTITDVTATRNTLQFTTSGPTGTTGYINTTMPVGLNETAITVFVDGGELTPPPFPIITTNGTHYFIYFEFTQSVHDITMRYAIADVAVTNVTPAKSVVGQGYIICINATVQNQGDYEETFNVTVYANTTYIASQNVTLTSRKSKTITFTWNTTGFAKGNYTISAYAWPVQDETDTTDNTFRDGTVYVGIPGDVNADGKVDMKDITYVARRFLCKPGSKLWDPNADINGDGEIDMKDIVIVAKNLGKRDP